MRLKTIEVTAGVEVEVIGYLSHLCPFRNEVDRGTITMSWVTAGTNVELHSLHDLLRSYRHVAVSHEEVTVRIADALTECGLKNVEVQTHFITSGMQCRIDHRSR